MNILEIDMGGNYRNFLAFKYLFCVFYEIEAIKISIAINCFGALQRYLVKPGAAVPNRKQGIIQRMPIGNALSRKPMALVNSVVIRNVKRNDLIAQRLHKIFILFFKQMICIKANFEPFISRNKVDYIG